MHAGKNFTLGQTLYWTRGYILVFTIIAAVPVVLYQVMGWTWLNIPWLPIALVGTAVAFLLGFKNNAAYERLWEARKIWGAIVNTSRTWGVMSMDFVSNLKAERQHTGEELHSIHQRLIYRHVAWLTALRFQLRMERVWEHHAPRNERFRAMVPTELSSNMREELVPFLSPEELDQVMRQKNVATQILALQSRDLKHLRAAGCIDDFRHVEMKRQLSDLYVHQGKCERIKNFPFPRQYATLNLLFVWLFILLVPFGLLNEFKDLGGWYLWLCIPFSVIVSWVFHTMELLGEYSENPFEGLINDVPITALSRTIEIDLREMLGETELPESMQPESQYWALM